MPDSINPVSGEQVCSYDEHSTKDIEEILRSSESAFQSWKNKSIHGRTNLIKKLASVLRQNSAEYSLLMTLEMGKTIAQSEAEVEKCAWLCEYYAENAERFLEDEVIPTDARRSYATYQPLGIILGVMPWNFPFWQVFRFAVPAIAAGNTAILKHASNVTGCAFAIEKIFQLAGFPEGVFQTMVTPGNKVSDVIQHSLIRAVSITGSTPAGISVATTAGKVLKKCVLELGGSDPYIILSDADLLKSVESCVTSRLINAGQSCISAKRFIVDSKIYDDFVALFVEVMKTKTMGDPLRRENHLGPQARVDLRDELHQQVERTISKGAVNALGCYIPPEKGAWYPPSVLIDVKPGMAAFDEELFGPVAAIVRAKDEEDAVILANKSAFGLGAAIFTGDIEKGEHIAKFQLEAGCCFVNSFVKSDPRLPFGGIKGSGFGRELSHHGIKEFVNVKTVYIK